MKRFQHTIMFVGGTGTIARLNGQMTLHNKHTYTVRHTQLQELLPSS